MRFLAAFFFATISFSGHCQTVKKVRSSAVQYHITPSKADTARAVSTEKRIALVIGNNNYKVGPLENAANDANDFAELLKKKEFHVEKIINGTRLEIKEKMKDFAERIADGGIGLFYYSGHGVQLDGENYLVPVDAVFEYKEEVPDECIKISTILRYMETSNNKLNIIILDACRNTPFKTFSRSGEKGMVPMDAPTGSIIAYSTSPGKTASDGTGRNGLYTSKLMKYMDVPGLKIEEVFKQVRIEVSKESGNLQIPWESNSLMGDFYLSKH